jgi:nicotinate-nucleotide adenylyltransferase
MGNDAFAGFTSWHAWQEILQLAHILVTTRPGTELPMHGAAAELLAERYCEGPQDLARHPSGGILPCRVRALDISATEIRAHLAMGRDASTMLPSHVWQYICSHGLYSMTRDELRLSMTHDGN